MFQHCPRYIVIHSASRTQQGTLLVSRNLESIRKEEPVIQGFKCCLRGELERLGCLRVLGSQLITFHLYQVEALIHAPSRPGQGAHSTIPLQKVGGHLWHSQSAMEWVFVFYIRRPPSAGRSQKLYSTFFVSLFTFAGLDPGLLAPIFSLPLGPTELLANSTEGASLPQGGDPGRLRRKGPFS